MREIILYLPLLLIVVGLVLYFATKDKTSEVGRICFFVGLLVFLLNR